jgi:hypothetical protein
MSQNYQITVPAPAQIYQITAAIPPTQTVDVAVPTVGPAGEQGAQGPQGPQGPQGAAGASAWEDITGKPSVFPPEPMTFAGTKYLSSTPSVLTAARNQLVFVFCTGVGGILQLPTTGNQLGDLCQVVTKGGTIPATVLNKDGSVVAGLEGSWQQAILFIYAQSVDSATWYPVNRDTINHSGDALTPLSIEPTSFLRLPSAPSVSPSSGDLYRNGNALVFFDGSGTPQTLVKLTDLASPPAIGNTTPSTGAFTTLSGNNGTLTASAPVLGLAQVWNNSAVAFTSLKLAVTNTASLNSASGSKLLDITIDGSSLFRLQRNFSAGYLYFGTTDTGVGAAASGTVLTLICNGGATMQIGSGAGGPVIRSDSSYAWASSTNITSSADLVITRDAANILAQRNGTNAQEFRIYNTYTDASNYERGFIRWTSNILRIGTEKLGTGSDRAIEFWRNGSRWAYIDASGFFNADGGFLSGGQIRVAASAALYWSARTMLKSPADGTLKLSNVAETDFGTLQFGGTTNLFPAIKRNGTTLEIKTASDSAFAGLAAGNLTLYPSSSVTPSSVRGEIVVEATSNTTLTFKMRGLDDAIRSGTITLS